MLWSKEINLWIWALHKNLILQRYCLTCHAPVFPESSLRNKFPALIIDYLCPRYVIIYWVSKLLNQFKSLKTIYKQYTHMHVLTHMHTCMHTHTRTCVHTHKHAQLILEDSKLKPEVFPPHPPVLLIEQTRLPASGPRARFPWRTWAPCGHMPGKAPQSWDRHWLLVIPLLQIHSLKTCLQHFIKAPSFCYFSSPV